MAVGTRLASTVAARRRVVVTGMGLVTPLGCGVANVWQKLLAGRCGIRRIEDAAQDYDKIPCKVAAFVPKGELDVERCVKKSEARSMSLATVYALIAADEALTDAKWLPQTDAEKRRTGVAIGMGMNDMEEIINTGNALRSGGYNRVSPFFVTKVLTNLAAGHVSIRYNLQGPNHCVSTACTTGVHAVGDALRFIQWGDTDVMVCGSTEACISPLSVAAFARMRALATTFNDCPEQASRPFDHKRAGFVMGEGAGIIVLESLEHALQRSCTIHAELLGYGLSGDGFHVTAPSETGSGGLRCMESALSHARRRPQDIGYINAHATSTPLGDEVENKSVENLFGEHASRLAVSSTKGAVGHLLGAAGAVETIFTVMACKTGVVPPTINLDRPGDGMRLNYVPNAAQEWPTLDSGDARIALTNSFGFGGTNASLCISNYKL